MKLVEKKEVKTHNKTRNNYGKVREAITGALQKAGFKPKDTWTIKEEEATVYKLLGSGGRNHLSSKYALAGELGKQLTQLSPAQDGEVFCRFSQAAGVFYFSNSKF